MADPASNEVLIYKYFYLDNNLERNTLNDYSIFLNTAIYFHMFNWFGTPYGQEFSCALLIKKSNFCQKVTVSPDLKSRPCENSLLESYTSALLKA